MARPLRIEYEGAFYHVVQRGIERKNIFASDRDKERFLSYLKVSHSAYNAIFHTYVLMDNHYHLIVETPRANISKIMHYINASFAAYYNAKHKRVGPLYQGRFKAIPVQEDEYLHHLSCYIHLNPVRAGIVKSPEEHPYSSYSFFTTKKEPPEWLATGFILSMFDKKPGAAKELYKRFVMGNIGKEKEFINSNIKNGWILGDENFLEAMQKRLEEKPSDPELPLLTDLKRPAELSLDEIKRITEKYVKDNPRLCRSVSIYLSRKYTQKTLKEIAAFYGNTHYASISQVWRRIGKRREKDRGIGKLLAIIDSEIENVSSVKT